MLFQPRHIYVFLTCCFTTRLLLCVDVVDCDILEKFAVGTSKSIEAEEVTASCKDWEMTQRLVIPMRELLMIARLYLCGWIVSYVSPIEASDQFVTRWRGWCWFITLKLKLWVTIVTLWFMVDCMIHHLIFCLLMLGAWKHETIYSIYSLKALADLVLISYVLRCERCLRKNWWVTWWGRRVNSANWVPPLLL